MTCHRIRDGIICIPEERTVRGASGRVYRYLDGSMGPEWLTAKGEPMKRISREAWLALEREREVRR